MNNNIYSFQTVKLSDGFKQTDKTITIKELFDNTRKGTYAKDIEAYRGAKKANPKAKKEDYVGSFMPHGVIHDKIVRLREDDNTINHSRWDSTGVIHIDLDHIAPENMADVRTKIESTKPLLMFGSPSGDGLKVFFKHDVEKFDTKLKENFILALRYGIRTYLQNLDLGQYYDPAATEANRQCYFSFDKKAVYNEGGDVFPLTQAYGDLFSTDYRLKMLREEFMTLTRTVPNVITVQVKNEFQEELETRLQRHILESNNDGNGEAFSFACWLIRSGLSSVEVITQIERIRTAKAGKWSVFKKESDARRTVERDGNKRNRYASDTIEIDAGIDTRRYEEIQTQISDLEHYRKAGKDTITRQFNETALSMTNQRIPRSTKLVRDGGEYVAQARRIFNCMNMCKLITVVENAGSGKSRTMGELAKFVRAEMDDGSMMGIGTWKGMLFCTNTRDNRNAFAKANPQFVVWKGQGEIIEAVTNNDPEVKFEMASFYDDNDGSVLDHLIAKGLINLKQQAEIKEQLHQNRALANSPFIACCHAKIRKGEAIKKYQRYVVVMDEMAADDVVHIEEDDEVSVFNGAVKVKMDVKQIDHETEVKAFMGAIAEREVGGVIMLSAEKSLIRAFGSDEAPNLKMKKLFGSITVKHLGCPRTLVDDNFTCAIVKGLGNSKKEDEESIRYEIAQMLRGKGYYVISDGKVDRPEGTVKIGDITIEGCKGSNVMMDMKTAVLIGCPSPEAIGTMMMRLSCDEATAVSVIISDQANQAIGRNVGYRNRGAECLLVVAAGNLRNGKTIELDIISRHFYDISNKVEMGKAPPFIREMFEGYINDQLSVSGKVAGDIMGLFSADNNLVVKDADMVALIKEYSFSKYNTPKSSFKNGGLMTSTKLLLEMKGLTKARTRVDGVRGTYWFIQK